MKIRFNIAKCLCVCHRIYGWLNVLHRYVCCAGLIMQHRVTQYSSIYFDYEEGKTVAKSKSGDKHFYMPDDFVGDRLPARNSHSILFSKWEALENGLIRLTNACVEWNHHPPRKKKERKERWRVGTIVWAHYGRQSGRQFGTRIIIPQTLLPTTLLWMNANCCCVYFIVELGCVSFPSIFILVD